MKNSKLFLLGLVAAAMVIWAVVQDRIAESQNQPVSGGGHLIQGLDTALIDSIAISAGDSKVTLKRQGDGFVVVEKGDYPADIEQINKLINKLLDIKTTEVVTENADNHADLGVTEDKAKAVVKFMNGEGELIGSAIIGGMSDTVRGSYVRRADSDVVYLSENTPWLRTSPLEYTVQKLVGIESDKIKRVKVSGVDGEYNLTKDDSDKVGLDKVPSGKQVKQNELNSVFNAMGNVSFSDVKKESEAEGMNFNRKYVCQLKDSTVYRFELAEAGGKYYAKCSADFTDKSQVMKENRKESEEELKEKEAKLLAREGAEKFTAEHEGWVYELAEYQAKKLMKKVDELVEDIPQPEPAEEKAVEDKPVEPAATKVEPVEPAAIKSVEVKPETETPAAPAAEPAKQQ